MKIHSFTQEHIQNMILSHGEKWSNTCMCDQKVLQYKKEIIYSWLKQSNTSTKNFDQDFSIEKSTHWWMSFNKEKK